MTAPVGDILGVTCVFMPSGFGAAVPAPIAFPLPPNVIITTHERRKRTVHAGVCESDGALLLAVCSGAFVARAEAVALAVLGRPRLTGDLVLSGARIEAAFTSLDAAVEAGGINRSTRELALLGLSDRHEDWMLDD